MVDARAIVMSREELEFWAIVRRRGAIYYLLHKGLLFLLFYPLLGHFVADWPWQPSLFLEAWAIGVVCGGFVWMRKELRFRYTHLYARRLLRKLGKD